MNLRTVRNQTIVRQPVPLVCLVVLVIAIEFHAELKAGPDPEINSVNDDGPAAEHQESCQLHSKAIWEGQALFRELFEAMPKFVGIASAGFYEFEASDVRKSLDPDCLDSSNDHSCWNSIGEYSDGQEWSLLPSTNESLSFSGRSNCTNQKLSGSGTTTWRWTSRWDLRVVRGMGEWSSGKQEGIWTYEIFSAPCVGLTHIECRLNEESTNALPDFEDGPPYQPGVASTFQGTHRNGLRTGIWVANFNNGDATEIPYESDTKHGTQTYRHMVFKNFENEQLVDRYEIPWVSDKKHGRQVRSSWNGDQDRISWHRGIKHGESIYHWRTGETEKTSWVNGMQHGTAVFEWPSGSRLTTLFDKGMKIGYEVVSLSPKSESDFVNLQARYSEKAELNNERPDFLTVSRTFSRLVDGVKHGVEIWLRPVYGHRIYIPHWEGKALGTQINVQEQHFVPYYSFYHEKSRQRSSRLNDRYYGISVLAAHDGFRRESSEGQSRRQVIQLSANGSYLSRFQYENGGDGNGLHCWYEPIPWVDDGMKGINVFSFTDGVRGYYPWPFVSWHGPLSETAPNGLCLETPYTGYKKSGIEIQTQTNGYRAHIPMRGRHLAGKLTVFVPEPRNGE